MTTLVETSTHTIKDNLIQRYPLPIFFLLAFGLTWIFMITDALGSHEVLPLPLMLVMGYMPTLAAVIVTGQLKAKYVVSGIFD